MTLADLKQHADLLPVVRTVNRGFAPLWLTTIVAPEVAEELDAIGVTPEQRHAAARSAPLGKAPLSLVVATFFNFSPAGIGRAIPSVWETTTPDDVLAAQLRGVDRVLRRAFEPVDPTVIEEALDLLGTAAAAACARPEGRPLFAAYAALPWPTASHLALWHAHYLLREFRGDGHISAMVAEGFTGAQALALHIAQLPALGAMFRHSRAWTDQEWTVALDDLRSDGWIEPGDDIVLTESGAARREAIELRTDELDLPAWIPVGRAGCDRLLELGKVVSGALEDAGIGIANLPRPSVAQQAP